MLPDARGKDVRLESPPPLNPLHEKFDSWLTSTFASSPHCRKARKRTARLLRPLLGHSASAPAAADIVHAEKQLSTKPKRPVTSLPSIETIQRQRLAALVAEASYRSFSYPSRLGLGPGLLFTKALGALANTDAVLLPATLVREDSGMYRLVYSNADQRICTREYTSKANVEADTPLLLRLFTRRQQAICAVVKTYDPTTRTNTLDLLETRQDVARALRGLLLVTSGVVGLQEFIAAKPNRVQSSLLVRCAYVPTRPKQSVVWVFTDTAHPVVDTTDAQACRVDKATAPTSWAALRAQTQVLATNVAAATSIRFTSLVADFAQDEEGRWWCLQVKAFRAAEVETPEKPPATAPKCAGQFCKESATPREMGLQPLLYKDILRGNFLAQNTDLPNVAAAYEVYAQSWSRRVRNQLYNRVLVCTKCHDRYNQLLVPSMPLSTPASSASLQQLLASMEAMVPELTPLNTPGTDRSTLKDVEDDEAPTNQEPTPRALSEAHVVQDETEHVHAFETHVPLTTSANPAPLVELERLVTPETIPCSTPQDLACQSSQATICSASVVVKSAAPPTPPTRRASVVDSFWNQLQPAKPQVAPVLLAVAPPVVVLPKHAMTVDPSRVFFDDQYKQSILVEMHAMMAEMHTVVISATSDDATATMALQSLFLEVQDDCIEGMYGLDAVDTINGRPQLTVTPHFSTQSRSI